MADANPDAERVASRAETSAPQNQLFSVSNTFASLFFAVSIVVLLSATLLIPLRQQSASLAAAHGQIEGDANLPEPVSPIGAVVTDVDPNKPIPANMELARSRLARILFSEKIDQKQFGKLLLSEGAKVIVKNADLKKFVLHALISGIFIEEPRDPPIDSKLVFVLPDEKKIEFLRFRTGDDMTVELTSVDYEPNPADTVDDYAEAEAISLAPATARATSFAVFNGKMKTDISRLVAKALALACVMEIADKVIV